jgi:hypothetical protein
LIGINGVDGWRFIFSKSQTEVVKRQDRQTLTQAVQNHNAKPKSVKQMTFISWFLSQLFGVAEIVEYSASSRAVLFYLVYSSSDS